MLIKRQVVTIKADNLCVTITKKGPMLESQSRETL